MLCIWQSPQSVIKGSQRVKHSQKHSQTHETQPPSATSSRHHHANPILQSESWCSISAAVCSPLISVTVWSQDRDLSLSRSLSQTVWSTPRCVHSEFWLNPNDIYQTQPRFSCGVVKPASDCFNQGSLVSKCADCGLTCQMFRYINIGTGRMEMESHLRPNAGRCLYVGFNILLLIIKFFWPDLQYISHCEIRGDGLQRLVLKTRAYDRERERVTAADGFALQELCVCVCVWERQASPRGLDSKAKLPMQRWAVEASNKLLHVIWMRPELPAEQSEELGPVWI